MEGKKKYFALIIFLFLGLMIFTFANPAEEEKEFKGGDKEQSETVTNKREDTTEEDDEEEQEQQQDANQQQEANQQQNVTTNNNQGNAQGGNQGNNPGQTPVNPVDNTLRDALAAVEKAEGTYTQKDVDAAKQLVNQVTDTTEKGKLEERLDEVEAGIAALALLENLETQVEEALEKADMTNATSYRDTNEIAKKIEDLNNETVKETLQERLDKVSKLLDDNAAPTTKVEPKAYNDNVEITAEDEAGNPFKMYLTKGNEKEKEISSGDKTTSDGVYTLRLIDEAFNEQTVTFTVDTVAPVLKDLTNGAHYPEITLTVEDLTKTKIEVTNMDKNETTVVEDGTKLTENATYRIILTDEAGNKTEYWLAIDSLKPTISVKDEVVEENTYINENTEVKVFDKFLTNVSITYEDAKANKTTEEFTRIDFTVGERNENFTLTYELTKEGTYTITGTDKYGNEKTVKVTYDSTVAKKNVVNANVSGYDNLESYQYAINGKTITAYFNINEELKHNPTFTFYANGKKIAEVKDEVIKSASTNKNYPYKYTAILKIDENLVAENGLITFTITDIYDKAGNKTDDITAMTRTDKVITLDRTLPKSTYVAILSNKTENHKYVTNGQLVRVLAAFDEEIKLTKDFVLTINGKNYKFQRSQDTTRFEYIVEFKIPENETSMPEGEVQFAISGYQDLAGNAPTTVLTTANHYKYNSLTYDRTAPKANNVEIKGITSNPGYAKVGDEIWVGIIANEQMATLPTITINGVVGEKVQEIVNESGHLYYAKVNMTEEMASGEIQFTIDGYKDAAGNQGIKLTNKDINLGLDKIVLDKTKPELRIKPTSVGKDPYYSKIEFKLYDSNSADYYIINGTKKDFTNNNISDANYQNLKAYLKTGKNKIELYDVAGNKTEKEFYYYEGYIFIETAQELKDLFADSAKLDNKKVMLIADIDMKEIQWKAASNVSFTLDGQNHTVSNVTYESDKSTGLFVDHLGANRVTFKNIIVDNANIKNNKAEGGAAAIFVADADTADEIIIKNCVVRNSKITNVDGWVGGFVGYTAGYNNQNDGPVYSDVTIEDSEINNSTLTGAASSVGAAVGHSGGNPDTTTTIKNFTAKNNVLKGEKKAKTGVVVGTAHVGKTIISNVTNENNTVYDEQNSKALYGRFVPNGTGYLEIDGERIYIPINVNTIAEFKKALAEGYKEIIINKTLDVEEDLKLSATKQTVVKTKDTTITMFNVKEGKSLTLENLILDGENKRKIDITKAADTPNDPFNYLYPTTDPDNTRIYTATSLINSNGTLTLGAGTVIRNYAHQPVSPHYGGPAISVTGGSVIINGLEFTNNVSQLLTAKNATVTINNINVHDTWATGDKAGLIEINTGATMDVNNGTFKNNMMTMRSYGLFIASAGTINMKGGLYENNYSTKNGGNTAGSLFGVETTGKIYMTGGTVQNNIGYRAGSFATRWANEGSIIELNGGTIKNNTTRSDGFKNAGIFVQSNVKIGANMIVEEKVVLRNAEAVLENNGKIVGDVELMNTAATFNNNGTVTGNIIIPE